MDNCAPLSSSVTTSPRFQDRARRIRARRAFSLTALGVFTYQVLSTILAYALLYLCALTGIIYIPVIRDNYTVFAMIVGNAIPMYAIAFPVVSRIFRRMPRSAPDGKPLGAGFCISLFFIAEFFSYAGSWVSSQLMQLFGNIFGYIPENSLDTTLNEIPLWCVALMTVILAPVFEELMFRKFVIDRVQTYGKGAAIVFSGVIFGLIHGNFYQLFYTVALGLLFGYVYTCTGKIRYTIAYHMLFNFFGGFLPMLLMPYFNIYEELMQNPDFDYNALTGEQLTAMGITMLYSFGVLLLALTGLILLIVLLCTRKKKRLTPDLLPTKRVGGCMVVNLGSLLLFLWCTLQMVISVLPEDFFENLLRNLLA